MADVLIGASPISCAYAVCSWRVGRLRVVLLNGWPWLRFRIEQESPLISYAKTELARIRSGEPDEMQDAIDKHILTMVRVFADEGHSGSSAPYCIGILEKLLRFEPLTPLTGADDEWNDLGDGWSQNRRCSHVFRDDSGAYDSNGRVFVEPDGCAYTNRDSRVYVTFPYVPKIQYVKRNPRDEKGRFAKLPA